MRLLSLEITKFGPFRKTQQFTFPDGPGLYFLGGLNLAEPRLGGNGAGKSKMWDALTWLFFGTTSRGLKAGNAANWEEGKGSSVIGRFQRQDGVHTVIRTWSPIRWTLTRPNGITEDLVDDQANPVLGWLGLNHSTFLSTVLMAQAAPMFLDLDAGAQASLFSEVMGLDVWLDYSANASAAAKQFDYDLRRAREKSSHLQGRLDELSRQGHVEGQKDSWEQDRGTRLKLLRKEYLLLTDRHKTLKERVAIRSPKVEKARVALATASASKGEVEKHLAEIKGIWADASKRKAEAVAVFRQLEKSSELKPGQDCPTCGQTVDDWGKHDSQKIRQRDIRNAEKELTEATGEMETADSALAQASDLVSSFHQKMEKLRADLSEEEYQLRQAENEVARSNKVLDEFEDRYEAIEVETNPFEQQARRHVDALREVQDDLGIALGTVDSLTSKFNLATSWVRWFKEIRLGLIGEALEQLSIEVNSCMASLGLLDWELLFDVDKETKSGTISKGFSVGVISPHNATPVPWKSWSGGESQRLRIAGNMGLSNLIRARTGCPLDLEVWDEPTQWMAADGVADLLAALKKRAVEESRQIWIVDHRTLGFSDFDGTAEVIKDSAGSRFSLEGLYRSKQGDRDARQRTAPTAAGGKAHDVIRRRAPTT